MLVWFCLGGPWYVLSFFWVGAVRVVLFVLWPSFGWGFWFDCCLGVFLGSFPIKVCPGLFFLVFVSFVCLLGGRFESVVFGFVGVSVFFIVYFWCLVMFFRGYCRFMC